MKLGHACMGHIPSSMMKMTVDSFEISSLSIVTFRCQILSPTPYEIGTCSYGSYTKLNDENDCRFYWNIITIHSNLQLSKNVTTPYEIGTCSYGSYTKLIDENDSRFFWNIITIHSNLTPPKNVPHPVWNWDMLVWVIYQAQWWKWQ